MLNPVSYIINKVNRRILNLALAVVKRHVAGQAGLGIMTYNRHADILTPITWKARGVTLPDANGKAVPVTNNWAGLEDKIDYKGKIVLDVGASLGATVARFAKTASKVFAFEPHPDNFGFLNDQVKIRKLDNVDTYQMAVSNFVGETEFFGRESHGVHSLGVHNKGKVVFTYKVAVQTLDHFCASNVKEQIGLLKIDVEGFEVDVLRGASGLLKDKKIDVVLFEFSPRIHKLRKIDQDAPIKVLREHGYEVYWMNGEIFAPKEDEYPKICDLYATPK